MRARIVSALVTVLIGTVVACFSPPRAVAAQKRLPPVISVRQDTQAVVVAILADAVRYVVDTRSGDRRRSPSLLAVGLTPGLAGVLGIDPKAIRDSVSARSGVLIWDGSRDRYCDIQMARPRWRLRDPGTSDYRIAVSLQSLRGDTARVSYSVESGDRATTGPALRLLVARTPQGWSTLGRDPNAHVIDGVDAPCRPPAPKTPEEELSAIFSAGILQVLGNPLDDMGRRPVRHACVSQSISGYPWSLQLLQNVRRRLTETGLTVLGIDGCVQLDEAAGRIRYETAQGEPAMSLSPRFVVAEEEEVVTIQLEFWPGTESCSVLPSPLGPCILECTVERAGDSWTGSGCRLAPFLERGSPGGP